MIRSGRLCRSAGRHCPRNAKRAARQRAMEAAAAASLREAVVDVLVAGYETLAGLSDAHLPELADVLDRATFIGVPAT